MESKTQELLDFFELFFTHRPKPIYSALEFADALALRTQILKNELSQNQSNTHIKNLYLIFKTQLYEKLEFKDFCDNFAQTLTYSLFLAKLNNHIDEKIDLCNVKKFIPKSFPLIRTMSNFFDELEDLASIRWLLDENLQIINHINISNIIKELNQIKQKDPLDGSIHKDPYLHFYETFLARYDPKRRKKYGVFYTPASVVHFIINAIDQTLKNDFNLLNGLSSALDSQKLTLLDFATGTGTFLLEAFRKALESVPKNTPQYNPKKLLPQFLGFELLIAPYTIAHIKLSQSFKEEFHTPLKEDERLRIYLTNTLYSEELKRGQRGEANLFAGMHEIFEEAQNAQKSQKSQNAQNAQNAQKSKDQSILIITGNPPYSGASNNQGLYQDQVKIAYQLEPNLSKLTKQEKRSIEQYFTNKNKENQRAFEAIFKSKKLKERTTKWLLDDYVKFICFGESKIKAQNKGGIFAFISNNGFLDNPTFRGMRHSLLSTFDKIYILNLHGNARKKECSPDGSKDENVFDIQQGVSINLLIKSSQKSTKNATLYYCDLYGKRKDKHNFLYEQNLDSIIWDSFQPKGRFYLFTPQNESLREEYDQGWSIKEIFGISSVGIISGRDQVCISDAHDKNSLFRFKNKISTLIENTEAFKNKFNISEDAKSSWQIKNAKNNINETGNEAHCYREIHYRPFDLRWTYYTHKQGFLARPRFKVMRHFLQDFANPKNAKDETPQWLENFTPSFRAFIDSHFQEHFTAEEILGYIYAILFHKDYRKKYIDFLKVDFPKIPFTKSKQKFITLSNLGLKLIKTHLMKTNIGESNIGLVCDKGAKLQEIDNIFITQNIIDLHLVGSGSYVFPLFIRSEDARNR